MRVIETTYLGLSATSAELPASPTLWKRLPRLPVADVPFGVDDWSAYAKPIAERLVATLRRECLDHLIILDEAHLRSILAEFARYHNAERPHRALDLDTSIQRIRPATGPIRASPAPSYAFRYLLAPLIDCPLCCSSGWR